MTSLFYRFSSQSYLAISSAALALSLGACATDSGGLRQATFSPDCPSTDETCFAFGISAPIATGARLPLRVDSVTAGSATPLLTLEAIDESVVRAEGHELIAEAPGMSAVLVTTDELVFDFIHVWVEDPTDLEIRRHTTDGQDLGSLGSSVQMLSGESLVVGAKLTAGGTPLLGHGAATWTVSDDATLTAVQDGIGNLTRFVARQPGTSTISAERLGLTSSIEVEVLP